MDKINTITKQAEKILAYGINEGYMPNEGLFCNLSYYINGLMDVAMVQGMTEEEALELVILTQETMIELLNIGHTFEDVVHFVRVYYEMTCGEAGLHP